MLMRCFCWSSRELSIIWRWQICLWRENREPWISSKQHFFNKIHERISNHFFLLARHDSRQTIWKNFLCGKYGDEKIFPLIRMTRHVCKHRMKNVFLNLILSFFCSWFFLFFMERRKNFTSHMFQNELMFCRKYNARVLTSSFLYVFEFFLVGRQCKRICLLNDEILFIDTKRPFFSL